MSHWPDQPRFLRLLFSSAHGTTRSVEVGYDRKDDVWHSGVWFDGSSVPGLERVNASDLLLRPIWKEPMVQPWDRRVALALCEVRDVNGNPHPHDVRNVLRRVAARARELGYALKIGAELEFYLVERNGDGSVRPTDAGGYLSAPPLDQGLSLRREAVEVLDSVGVPTTSHHHEVGSGQHEIGIRHSTIPEAADNVIVARLAISELAMERGLVATFMPKPFEGLPGNGMHLHQSLWDSERNVNLFASEEGSGLSELALHYIAGILEHARALTAIVASTVNSFRRLRPGFEAPTCIAWGPRNRTAMIRVPQFSGSSSAARVEVRCPDPLCSPYLAMAAILAAGLDGIERELPPPEPATHNLFEDESECDSLPDSLGTALEALRHDGVIRTALGDTFTDYLVASGKRTWEEFCRTANGDEQVTSWEMSRYLLAA
ncbi:MAG: glutamine synthetase family protein [Candidatus Thorarchaeota archaeon]